MGIWNLGRSSKYHTSMLTAICLLSGLSYTEPKDVSDPQPYSRANAVRCAKIVDRVEEMTQADRRFFRTLPNPPASGSARLVGRDRRTADSGKSASDPRWVCDFSWLFARSRLVSGMRALVVAPGDAATDIPESRCRAIFQQAAGTFRMTDFFDYAAAQRLRSISLRRWKRNGQFCLGKRSPSFDRKQWVGMDGRRV